MNKFMYINVWFSFFFYFLLLCEWLGVAGFNLDYCEIRGSSSRLARSLTCFSALKLLFGGLHCIALLLYSVNLVRIR